MLELDARDLHLSPGRDSWCSVKRPLGYLVSTRIDKVLEHHFHLHWSNENNGLYVRYYLHLPFP